LTNHDDNNNNAEKAPKKKIPKKERFSYDNRYHPNNNSYKDDILDDLDDIYEKNILNDVVSWDDSNNSTVVSKNHLNSNFINIQFHNDYRDIITAFNNLVPDKKQRFNLPNRPLHYSEPESAEVRNLVNDFIKIINDNLQTEVPSHRNPNSGWDEMIPDPTIKSGWDKTQESLKLPTSLYEDPTSKAPIKLISIKQVQKYETEDEIKYSIEIVIQKVNVEDQMIIKGSFVQDKQPLHNENNFFKTSNIEMKITIEDLFIIGYLSDHGSKDTVKLFESLGDREEKWYDYNKLEYNNMTDPKYIQKILMEKYKQRTDEMEQRNAMLDEEGQQFHKELPHIYDFSNIKGTRTIFDDFNTPKTFV
jgi:hypothetical protein